MGNCLVISPPFSRACRFLFSLPHPTEAGSDRAALAGPCCPRLFSPSLVKSPYRLCCSWLSSEASRLMHRSRIVSICAAQVLVATLPRATDLLLFQELPDVWVLQHGWVADHSP